MKAINQIYPPGSPERQAAHYALFLLQARGVDTSGFTRVEVYTSKWRPGTVWFDTMGRHCGFKPSEHEREELNGGGSIRVELPGLSMVEWQEQIKKTIGPNGRTKPSTSIKRKGITVQKRWDWTEQREREEHNNIDRLFKSMGWVSCKLTKLPGEGMHKHLAP